MTDRRLIRRYRRERLFKRVGLCSAVLAVSFLIVLIAGVCYRGWRGILSVELHVVVHVDPGVVGADGTANALAYQKLLRKGLLGNFPDLEPTRVLRTRANELLSFGGALRLRDKVLADPALVGAEFGFWAQASSLAESHVKRGTDSTLPDRDRVVKDLHLELLEKLEQQSAVRTVFNWRFFTSGDSRDPELAGIGGALAGSLLSLLVCFALAFPMSVAAALYMELFARRSLLQDVIEVSINNLAAVPSVIFGLLGLAVFINFFGMPRSTPLVGGAVLALMTFPTMVIAARASIRAVPPSLLNGALSLGATKLQGVFHLTLPLAMPGIMTGTILGMSRALGETAPLLLIGMIAFITEVPSSFVDHATALPAQIFLWSDSPERGFVERTALGIVVLLVFLVVMNSTAVWLRYKFENKL